MSGRFRYRAATPEGQVVEGVLQAASEALALGQLQRQRLYPMEIAPLADDMAPARGGRLGRGPALALFARTLSTLLSAGVTLERALAFAARQSPHPGVAAAARRAGEEMRAGAALTAALAREEAVFGTLFVGMASAGEESGALDEAMQRLADHLDEMVELRAQVRSALLYPAVMAVTSIVGTAILLFFVVPRIVEMLAEWGGSLPLSTRLLLGASHVLVGGGWLLVPALAALGLAARAWLARPENRRRFHARRLTWPLLGRLELHFATARFARVLAMLLRSGQPLLPALRVARGAVANREVAAGLDRARDEVRRGQRLEAALQGVLPPLAVELIAVGEESGRLDELCLRVAEAYDLEARRALRTLVAAIEPAMILFFGVVVGFIALALLQAVYSVHAGMP